MSFEHRDENESSNQRQRRLSRRRFVALGGGTVLASTILAGCGDSATTVPTNNGAATSASTTSAATSASTTTMSSSTTAATAITTTAPATTTATTNAVGATSAASATTAAAAPAPTITPIPPVSQPAGSLKLTFWYGLGGFAGNILQRDIINKYNQSQNKYYVEGVFQASYEDTINKVNAALAGGNLPNILQIYDGGTQRMIDTGRIIPVQTLIERDNLQQTLLADLEPNMRNHYTVNGKLYCLPFNSSTAILYIDKKAFRAVGLDPEKKAWTYDEIVEAAQKLTKRDAAGKVTRIGLASWPETWHIEQELAIHNSLYADPGNGQSDRATKYVFNNDTSVKWLEFLKKLQDTGGATYYGVSGRSAAGAAYLKGEAAMYFDSTGSLRNYVDATSKNGNPIEVGTIFMPRRPDGNGSSIVGGAALWVSDQGTKEQQDGAWDFLKFAVRSDIQANWAASTGYLPASHAAYDLKDFKDALATYPSFQVAIDQLRASPVNVYNSGPIAGNFVSARAEVTKAIDAFLSGKAASAKAALDDAAKRANDGLDEYNSTVKK